MRADPDWVTELLTAVPSECTREQTMRLAVDLAVASAEHGSGPFGAVVADGDGRHVAVGWNRVLETQDSTAHAEIVALRRAQQGLGTHDLRTHDGGPYSLFSSCSPCIQCFGAIYWAGVDRVYALGTKEHAEAAGFDEGPVDLTLWARAFSQKGIVYTPEFGDPLLAERPFQVYRELGGVLY